MTDSRVVRWALIVIILLLGWGLRLVYLEGVPPGWRDDELINIHTLSSQVLDGQFPVYYLGASGHEPLYHHMHAGVHAILGFNVLSGHILSVMFGMLSIPLTYSLVRRLFPRQRTTAMIAALTLATSFWSLMYSRIAMRHISLLPFVLATLYVFWRQMDTEQPRLWGWGLTGFLLGTGIYTYTASRLFPVLLVVFVAYLALFHRDRFFKHWRGLALALVLTAVLVAPLGIAIARNRTTAAIEGIGADARVTELARPLRALLQDGDLRPVIEVTVETLGMFHASGDPEWLYNIPGRPVFNLLGGVLLWGGVILCLCRWREPRCFLLLAWLGLGLSPAFISIPPASLGHTIVAQPVAYILPALALTELRRALQLLSPARTRFPALGSWALILLFVGTNGLRDLENYFWSWPQDEMVRFLYRADYRHIAAHLDSHPSLGDLAVASTLMGPWDRLALEVDMERDDVDVRLFDPRRALVWTAGDQPASVVMTAWPRPAPPIADLLNVQAVSSETLPPNLTLHELSPIEPTDALSSVGCPFTNAGGTIDDRPYRFANGLELMGICWLDDSADAPDPELALLTVWAVAEPLDLPPLPLVANPPPPGVYAGPRLAVFAHLLASDADSEVLHGPEVPVAGDDGFWVDPLTLSPGDRFIQIHRFAIPEESATTHYTARLGLYDPLTEERWPVFDTAGNPVGDHVLIRAADR